MSRLLRVFLGAMMLALGACSSPTAPPTPSAGAPTTTVAPKPVASSSVAVASPSPLVGGKLSSTDPAIHVFLWGNAATTSRDLKLAKDAGFHWVKQRFEWRNIEGKNKASFEWDEPDRIVDAISQSGLKVIARVDNQPKWAATSLTWPATGPPDNPKDWSDYLTALATRYKGRIQAYEIWNEPNLDREWGNKKPDPTAYVSMLKSSYQAIKAADPQALVISAGMSPTATNDDHAMPDLDFIS